MLKDFINKEELNEECGVIGIINDDNVNYHLYLGLHALQHRGQEASGITTFTKENNTITIKREGSIVTEFKEKDIMSLHGNKGIGHVRYSTFGGSDPINIQPFVFTRKDTTYALVHNGNITNADQLKKSLEKTGTIFFSKSDSEILGHLIARNYQKNDIMSTLKDSLNYLEGGFAYVLMADNKMYGCRDKNGLRPLVIGKTDKFYILASETVALDIVGADFVRDLQPGEIVEIDSDNNIKSTFYSKNNKNNICAMEYVYFSRPDSKVEGVSVHETRISAGKMLAKEHPVEADVVIGVPDSSISAALGFAQESKIPYDIGLVKNKYIARSFIAPTQSARDKILKMKLNVNESVIKNKRVVLIDDSIVRGTTMNTIIKLILEAKPKELHLRIASPKILYPCYYGVDTSTKEELLLNNVTKDEYAKKTKVDSLEFLSLEGFQKALNREFGKNLCGACFTGKYVSPLVDKMKGS